MLSIRGLLQTLRATLLRGRVDAELDEELRDHAEREVARQIRDGAPDGDARRLAALRMGSLEVARENVRDERGGRLVADLAGDLRIGWRGLRRNTGLTAAVVLSLGLGVGGTTAIFSVVDAVLLRPLPYPDADRLHLARVWWNDFSAMPSPADFLALRDHGGAVAHVGAFTLPDDGFALQTEAGPELLPGGVISDTLPAVLGITPILGAGFSADRTAPEVLIAHDLWRSRFNGRADVIGQRLTLDGVPRTIVGVMPAGFDLPGEHNGLAWTRLTLREPTRRGPFYLRVVTRVDAAGPVAAEARLTEIVRTQLRERFGVKPDWRYGLVSLKETLVGDIRSTLLLAFTAVGLVLLIAVLNVTNLLLARGVVRQRELAVRASLGAGRGRLIRQLLAEAMLLGAMGGALGLALAWLAIRVGREAALTFVPRMDGAQIDWRVALFAIAVGIGSAVLAALLPVVRLPWTRLTDSLRASSRTSGEGRHDGRVRRGLVAAEVALALTVLVGATLLVKSLARLEGADPGFRSAGIVSFRLSLPFDRYDTARTGAFLTTLSDNLRAMPQVNSVAYASALPPDRLTMSNNYTLEGAVPEAAGRGGVAEWLTASRDYFTTLGIRVTRGRGFLDSDRPESPAIALVSESFARRRFPGQDAVGKRFRGGDWNASSPWITIVGVVSDVPYERGVWGGAGETVYTAASQNLRVGTPYFLVRASGDTSRVGSAIREAVRAMDASLPVRDVATMDERLRHSTLAPRVRGVLALTLASIGLALAVTGIYGVMSYHVSQRRRETAIRRALGARTGQVAGGVVGSGLRLAALGIVAGVGGALALTRSLSALLYQVAPNDPSVVLFAAAILAATAALACALPALRAARVDPVSILREE